MKRWSGEVTALSDLAWETLRGPTRFDLRNPALIEENFTTRLEHRMVLCFQTFGVAKPKFCRMFKEGLPGIPWKRIGLSFSVGFELNTRAGCIWVL